VRRVSICHSILACLGISNFDEPFGEGDAGEDNKDPVEWSFCLLLVEWNDAEIPQRLGAMPTC
jgi:hypothetical protein